jgi:hypothetical protein
MTVVDLLGNMQSGGMTPPFAGSAMNRTAPPAAPPSAPPTTAANDLPPGHPPISSSTTPAAGASKAPFAFELPALWRQVPASGMRKAAFEVADGDKTALLTVIDFPANAGPMMADPAAQAKRWRGEVGLPPISDEAIKAAMLPIEIDGIEAKIVEAIPDSSQAGESQADRATLAAMLTRGDVIWFFKLSGDRDLVAAQRDKFKFFLKSVRFTASGALDVN